VRKRGEKGDVALVYTELRRLSGTSWRRTRAPSRSHGNALPCLSATATGAWTRSNL
jgi:hypothetical protein